MFSFVKWFSAFVDRLKNNKGIWFTFLTTISVIGIFLSLYFVNFLVGDVAQKTYENQKNHYVLTLKNKIFSQNLYIDAISTVISKDKNIAKEFFANDDNASLRIEKKCKQLEANLNKSLGKNAVKIEFIKDIKPIKLNGIDVTKDGTFFKSIIPMADKNGTIISVVSKLNIDVLVDDYKREHKEFAFFLDESSVNKLSKEVKKEKYLNYDDKLYIQKGKYDSNYISSIKSLKLNGKLKENGYFKSTRYFYIYQKIYDHSGDAVGFVFIAEEIKDDNSFVNLVKNLVNTVTMIALGLIVSMILFLF